jgi:hypothetical protein
MQHFRPGPRRTAQTSGAVIPARAGRRCIDGPDLPPQLAGEYIGVTPATLKTWRCRRRGPAYYRGLGRQILYRQTDLDRFVESRRIEPEKA